MPDLSAAEFDSLHPQPKAFEDGGLEVARAVTVANGLHLLLRRAIDDPGAGAMLAGIACHVRRIDAKERALTEEEVNGRGRATFEAEMNSPTAPGSAGTAS
jgi:hypothetical protein